MSIKQGNTSFASRENRTTKSGRLFEDAKTGGTAGYKNTRPGNQMISRDFFIDLSWFSKEIDGRSYARAVKSRSDLGTEDGNSGDRRKRGRKKCTER